MVNRLAFFIAILYRMVVDFKLFLFSLIFFFCFVLLRTNNKNINTHKEILIQIEIERDRKNKTKKQSSTTYRGKDCERTDQAIRRHTDTHTRENNKFVRSIQSFIVAVDNSH